MFVTREDFRIKAEDFDVTKGTNILRIAAGAFVFPHVAGKFADISTLTLDKGTVGFFAKAGTVPAEFWVYSPRRRSPSGSSWCLVCARATRRSAPSRSMRCRLSKASAGPGTPAATSTR